MDTKKENRRDALLAELDLHKLEFATLRQEILQLIESQRQYLNLSIVAIGAGLGLSSYVARQDLIIVLLLFPFVFHILLWEMLKSWRSIIWTSRYLLEVLIPRVNYIINELGQSDQPIQTLGWEAYITSLKFVTIEERIFSFLSPSSYFIPVFAVGVLVIAFVLISQSYGHIPNQYEFWLIVVHLFLLVMAAMQIIVLSRGSARRAKLAG